MASWDPEQYNRFADERSRPFFDLVARIPDGLRPRRVGDLGCGPGQLTRALAMRWPGAVIVGIDSSPAMLKAASPLAIDGRLHFVAGDIASWRPETEFDLIVSNAALHWVPDHARLLPQLVAVLTPGGSLAVQVPYNHDEPCHAIYDAVRGEARWTAVLGPALPQYATQTPMWYAEKLTELGCAADLWETIYFHRLANPEAIVEWVKGSLLRPTLDRLGAGDRDAFLAQYTDRIRAAYPSRAGASWLRYRRLFFIATRPAGSPERAP